jgi:Family of unknown function (DUF6494)
VPASAPHDPCGGEIGCLSGFIPTVEAADDEDHIGGRNDYPEPTRRPTRRSCPDPAQHRNELSRLGLSLALSCLSESLVPISTPRAPHEIGIFFMSMTVTNRWPFPIHLPMAALCSALIGGLHTRLQLSIGRATMDEEALNISVRKFLKKLGVTAQREIEMAVRDADAKGLLKGSDPLPAKAVVTVGGIDLKFEIDGDIELS